jgi:hypothetical protein
MGPEEVQYLAIEFSYIGIMVLARIFVCIATMTYIIQIRSPFCSKIYNVNGNLEFRVYC